MQCNNNDNANTNNSTFNAINKLLHDINKNDVNYLFQCINPMCLITATIINNNDNNIRNINNITTQEIREKIKRNQVRNYFIFLNINRIT